MAFVFKPVVSRIRNGRKVRTRARFYWVRYTDADGLVHRHVLRLPNGERITDKEVAESELRKLIQRQERKAAGLSNR